MTQDHRTGRMMTITSRQSVRDPIQDMYQPEQNLKKN